MRTIVLPVDAALNGLDNHSMAKRCGTFDHTADVGFDARADSLGELYEALAEGLAQYICPRESVNPRQCRTLTVKAEDAEALAVDFLTEVLGLIQTEHFPLASVCVTEASENSLTAQCYGEPYEAARHELHTEVKAITYHLLKVAREDDHWVGRVIIDL